ncbi:major facilitator superfamily domain-containing protein [Tribonema minus]|uniref:Major facilitator superfamily domain-containing protein n=1 Tax=Tribonema minus TaxID=303371 RepID=A0A835ZES0_9STRA|nr:major facilitator superfamily domain-containing protein [Tribonema minus]
MGAVKRKHVMLLVACLQNFCCGGLLFGWAAITSMLTADISEGGAGLSRDYVHSIFVLGSSLNLLSPLVLGIVLDSAGPRVCSALSLLLVGAGTLLFGQSKPGFEMFVPGMALVAVGGPGVQSAIIHISNLFPTKKATATSIITGSFSLSFVVFLAFDLVWSRFRLSYSQIFTGYTAIVVVCLLLTLALMPDKPYTLKDELRKEIIEEPELSQKYAGKTVEDFEFSKLRLPSVWKKSANLERLPSVALFGRSNSPSASAAGLPAPPMKSRRGLKEESLQTQLSSGAFVRVTLLLMVASFWANFYIGTIGTQLGDQAYLLPDVQLSCLRIFTAITTGGVLGIPIVGAMMDSVGFPATCVMTLLLALVWSVAIMLQTKVALLVAFAAYSLFRTFLFTYFFGYLGDALGFRFFGITSGVSFAMAGLVGLIQYPLSDWGTGDCHLVDKPGCDHGNWDMVAYAQTATLALLLALPLFELYKQRQQPTQPAKTLYSDSPIVSRKLLAKLSEQYEGTEKTPLYDSGINPVRAYAANA